MQATHEYVLARIGSYATGFPVKSVGISSDGRWAVAGSLGERVRFFDLDAGPPFAPTWTSATINVTNKISRGSSHSVAISHDGRYVSAGTGTTGECADPTARGCLFLFERQGGGIPAWSRPLFATAYATDVTDDYVVVGSYPSVFTIGGSPYWDGPAGGTVVDLSADGRYLASSSGVRVYLHENVGMGFTQVWSFDVTPRAGVFAQTLDLAEDGLSLAVGEDDAFDSPDCCMLYQFWPSAGQWTPLDRSPCLSVRVTNDIYAVAVAGETSNLSGERVLIGDTWGRQGMVFPRCNATPASTWATSNVAVSADATRGGCLAPDPCFFVFGGYYNGVYLTQEGDTGFDIDYTNGIVNAVAMSDEALPRIVAGSDDGSVYFYRVLSNRPDYVPWEPLPLGEIRVGAFSPVDLSARVKNAGGGDARFQSTIAFLEEGAASPFYSSPLAPLAAGWVTPRFTATWTAPASPGIYRVRVIADYGNVIAESDEGNNAYTFVLNVTAAPVTTLTIGTPQVAGPPPYVTSATPFSLSALDVGGSGIAATLYRIDGGTWLDYGATGPFVLPAEGEHLVEYYSRDNLGVEEGVRQATARVDDTPPTTTLVVGSPNYTVGGTFATSSTPLTLFSFDGGAMPVGLASTEYRVDGGTWVPYATPFAIGGDGPHIVEYRSVDRLGNAEIDQTFAVIIDDSPPSAALAVSDPRFGSWVTSTTSIDLGAVDVGNPPVGVATLEHREWFGRWTAWALYQGAFLLGGEGVHYVEVRATDWLGNSGVLNETLIVDDTPPSTSADVGTPQYRGAELFVTSRTPIRLPSADGGLVPVGINATEFRIDGGAWNPVAGAFTLAGEGRRTIEFRSWDRLGNMESIGPLALVLDDTPPTATVARSGPSFVAGDVFVTSATTFALTAVDGGDVPVGLDRLEYRIGSGPWTGYSAPFTLVGSDGPRTIEWRATDLLGNARSGSVNVVVDNTAPVTTPSRGDGTYPPGTTFDFTAWDAGSGVGHTMILVDGGSWTTVTEPLSLVEGSHIIRFRSVDRLNNTEAERVLYVTISEAPPPPSALEGNWKPLVALVFSAILVIVGVWSSRRVPSRTGPRPGLRAFTTTALPFVIPEAGTGVVSLLTGWLAIPPVLGVGTAVDLGILIAGLVTLTHRVRT